MGFKCLTIQEHVSSLSVLSEVTSNMCRHFQNMCRHFKPSSFSWYTLSPCVDTWSSIFKKHLAFVSMCRYFNVMCRHLQFQIYYCFHVSTLLIHWTLFSCIDTSKSCVDISNPICLLSICVDSFTRCVGTHIPRFESMLTVLSSCVDYSTRYFDTFN